MAISHRKTIDNIHAYQPGKSVNAVRHLSKASRVVKLASNENALGPAVALSELTQPDLIHVYPDYATTPLLPQLARFYGLVKENIILGNGSDELMTVVGLAYLEPGDEVLASRHTFSQYRFVSHLMSAHYVEAPSTATGGTGVGALISAITPRTKVIFIANPNNPTGTYLSASEFERLMAAVPPSVMVVMDEAYYEYATASDYPQTGPYLSRYSNLVIMRTFSKVYGLAGLRVGYGLADPKIIAQLLRVRQPFNVNTVALVAASLALDRQDFVKKSVSLADAQKTRLYLALGEMGLRYVPSQGNFVMIDLPFSANVAYEKLLVHGVIVRPLTSFDLPLAIRVTVGTPPDNTQFLNGLRHLLSEAI
jgi:histidinol-phosphate aminotransferase